MTANEHAQASNATLAQQALAIYDTKGEFAMLPFAMNHCRPKDQDDDHDDWTESGYLLLDDGSDITHLNGHYYFGWHNRQTGHQTHVERTSQMPDDSRPEPTATKPLPVVPSPNLYTVWQSVMDAVENLYDQADGNPVIQQPDTSYRLAPSLNNAIRQAIAEAKTMHYLEKYSDAIDREVANAALTLLPPDEIQALVDFVAARGTETEPRRLTPVPRNTPYDQPEHIQHQLETQWTDPNGDHHQGSLTATLKRQQGRPTPWRIWTDAITSLNDSIDMTEIVAMRTTQATFFDSLTVVDPTPETNDDAEQEITVGVILKFLIRWAHVPGNVTLHGTGTLRRAYDSEQGLQAPNDAPALARVDFQMDLRAYINTDL